MNRRIYRKSVAPHNQRVATDIGIPTDRVDKFIELMNFYEARKDTIKLLYNPYLTGNKIRPSGNLKFVSKGYSANSVQREFGNELITNAADREFSSDTGFWNKSTGVIINDNVCSFNKPNAFTGILKSIATLDKLYKITYTIKDYISGNIRCGIGSISGTVRNTNGTYIEYIICSGNTSVYFTTTVSNTVLSIDNVSIQEVLSNDLTQTTSTSQPYLSGAIAPTETLGIKNPNGGSNYLTHPTISFGANDTWSVTTVLNWNGDIGFTAYTGRFPDGGRISIKISNSYIFGIKLQSGQEYNITSNTLPLIGKTKIITVTCSNGTALFYIDGVLAGQTTMVSSNFDFNSILVGRADRIGASLYFHKIQNNAPSAQEVAQEHALLRALYPDIENVRIGEQTWTTSNCEMAATPMGNVIQEMQANANVEKITNVADREFSSDTGFWAKTNATISGDTANIISADGTTNSELIRLNMFTVGNWYRLQYDIVSNANGALQCASIGGTISSTVGTNKIVYFKALTTYINFQKVGVTNISIDNVSIQEVGWSGSQELYTGIFNQRKTLGDTDEQATYAAVKAAAMWCHYNNNVDNGAIYGKLYNWFAVKLLQMDIDYYNAANPNAMWGWRVNTATDYTTLSTYLGGNSVSGIKMKALYDSFNNSFSDNSSGLSLIPSKYRNDDGSFPNSNTGQHWAITESGNNAVRLATDSANIATTIDSIIAKTFGMAIRLIKV